MALNSPFRIAWLVGILRGLVAAPFGVRLKVFFGSLNFRREMQLVNIMKFSLPGNWAFWSVPLYFALRTASQITYQQLIHISCGLVPIKSPERKFHGIMIPHFFFR